MTASARTTNEAGRSNSGGAEGGRARFSGFPSASAFVLATAAALLGTSAVPAEGVKMFEVPGGDIFGFTNGTDTSTPGERGLALEWDNRFGLRTGNYWASSLKTQFSYGLAENLQGAISAFTVHHLVRDVTGLQNLSETAFDGLSGELIYRFMPRSESSPIAAAISIEPRYRRTDDFTGERVTAYSSELKLFLDSVLVPNRLYAALNLNYEITTQRDSIPDAQWVKTSSTNVSGAITYQFSEKFFVGFEARWLTAFDGVWLNSRLGQALFVGPNMLVNLSETTALNIAWTPQILGQAKGIAGHLDLDNFERHQLRVKLASTF